MGCGNYRKSLLVSEKKKQPKSKNIALIFMENESWKFGPKVISYFSLTELAKLSRVCKYFNKIAGDQSVLEQFQRQKNNQLSKSGEKYTYSIRDSKQGDIIIEKEGNPEHYFKAISHNEAINASVTTPKFISHPPTINDAIKKEMQIIEMEYGNKSIIDVPGHIFSMMDSLDNPNSFIGLQEIIRRKSIRHGNKSVVLSGV